MKKIVFVFLCLFVLFSCSTNEIHSDISEKVKSWEEITILALWDSITYWYKVDIDKPYPIQLENKLRENSYNYSIKNYWVSWDESDDLLARIDEILENNIEADIAILTIWWNDWLKKRSTSEMKENILEIIEKLEEKNIIVVFSWMKLPIFFGWTYSDNFEEVYKEIANEKKVFFYPYFLKWLWISVENNQADNIHPTGTWYTIISNNLYDFFDKNGLLFK